MLTFAGKNQTIRTKMNRDNAIFELIEKEHQRQLKGIELIASENFVSDQVMEAMGSYLTYSPTLVPRPTLPCCWPC